MYFLHNGSNKKSQWKQIDSSCRRLSVVHQCWNCISTLWSCEAASELMFVKYLEKVVTWKSSSLIGPHEKQPCSAPCRPALLPQLYWTTLSFPYVEACSCFTEPVSVHESDTCTFRPLSNRQLCFPVMQFLFTHSSSSAGYTPFTSGCTSH